MTRIAYVLTQQGRNFFYAQQDDVTARGFIKLPCVGKALDAKGNASWFDMHATLILLKNASARGVVFYYEKKRDRTSSNEFGSSWRHYFSWALQQGLIKLETAEERVIRILRGG